MMHSNELTIGTSPYSRTEKKHIDIMNRTDIVFKAARNMVIKELNFLTA